MAVTPLQSVESKGEILALELAEMLAAGKQSAASEKLSQYAKDKKLVNWEISAIADIASRMFHGKRWKKG